MKIDNVYLKSPRSVFKLAEFVGLIICISLMIAFEVQMNSAGLSGARYQSFFLFATITCLAVVVITHLVRMTGVHTKTEVKWTLMVIVSSSLCFLFLLISSCLILSDAVDYQNKDEQNGKTKCELWREKDASCDLYAAAGAVGLVVAIVFLLDAIWNIVLYVRVTGLDEESVVDKAYTAPVFDLEEDAEAAPEQLVAPGNAEMFEMPDDPGDPEAPEGGQVTTVADVRDPPAPKAADTEPGATADAGDASEPTTDEERESINSNL